MWQYDLDGSLRRVTDHGTFAPFDRRTRGLIEVSVGTYGGFVFVNPSASAPPLADHVDPVARLLDPYQIDEMVPSVLNARQPLECNWKIGVEAFLESYHVQSIHPQILPFTDDVNMRFAILGDHNAFMTPFGRPSPRLGELDAAEIVEGFFSLAAVFAGEENDENPLEALFAPYRNDEGGLDLPPGVSVESLFGGAVRESGLALGHDYSRLSDAQMTDSYNFFLFPNVVMVMRPGEFIYLAWWPDPDGDPNRCLWDVTTYKLITDPVAREKARAPREWAPEGRPLGLVLDQDRYQGPRQQRGLRNRRLGDLIFSAQECRIVHFHQVRNRYLSSTVVTDMASK